MRDHVDLASSACVSDNLESYPVLHTILNNAQNMLNLDADSGVQYDFSGMWFDH